MTMALIFISALIAFLFLCLGQGRHGSFPAFHFLQPRPLKILGAMILIASALMSIRSYGVAYGLVTWLGVAMIAALVLVLFLSWQRDRWKS
jgi:F0F1-type ATP synthase assembly protein I